MVKYQVLTNVCNGGHLYNLWNADALSLHRALGVETKAIAILGADQPATLKLFRQLAKRKSGLRTKRLCKWNEYGASL